MDDPVVRAVLRHVMLGEKSGGFVEALLSNDLASAVPRADPQNRARLLELCHLLFQLPSQSWGSAGKVSAWREARADDPLPVSHLEEGVRDIARAALAFR